MPASTALYDPRVKDMADDLQKHLDADPDEEDGPRPAGLEYLEDFLQDLTVNILERHNMPCPLVQPGEDGEIVLLWQQPSDALYVDVHLPSRKSEHAILHKGSTTDKGEHILKQKGWKTLGRKVSAWRKSTSATMRSYTV